MCIRDSCCLQQDSSDQQCCDCHTGNRVVAASHQTYHPGRYSGEEEAEDLSLIHISSMTTYLASSAGVEAGGKTGLSVGFTSVFCVLALFLAPIALMIPSAATAPVLMYICLLYTSRCV